LDIAWDGLPVNSAMSMGVHESQSLLWERMVALSPEYCRYLLPKIQAEFPEYGKGKSSEVLQTWPLCSFHDFRL
jgi:carboxypeptidase Taq